MTSYLRSWLLGAPSEPTQTNPPVIRDEPPEIEVVEPPEEEDRNSDDGYDTDRPPAFPALNSPQRAATASKPATSNRSTGLMGPPPPRLGTQVTYLGANANGANGLAPLTTTKVAKKSKKVALAPGHSTLDWANLKTSGTDLRGGVTSLLRVTPSMLKEHNKKDDAWTAINGKVYNMTPYLPYHPGGEKELMRVAGRDGTKLFALTHAWVSAEMMMDACMVGLIDRKSVV